jgi:peroxiredoxin
VSPQSHANTRALAARHDVPFRFLVDPDGRAAGQLGILHEAGVPLGIPGYAPDTVFPTAIVTDADGRILLADQTDNYRVRPEPWTFLAALDARTAGGAPASHRG